MFVLDHCIIIYTGKKGECDDIGQKKKKNQISF